MHLKTIFFTGILASTSISFAQPLQCADLFRNNSVLARVGLASPKEDSVLASMELVSRKEEPGISGQTPEVLQKRIQQKLRDIPATSIEISPLADGNFIILAQNISSIKLQKTVEDLNKDLSFEGLLKGYFKSSPAKNLKITLLPVNSTKKKVLIFEGKHAFPRFDKALHQIREGWDQRFPVKDYSIIGREHPFGTQIENAGKLIGLNIVGIGVSIKRIISKPLERATIEEFSGKVIRIENINDGGADPVWMATLQTSQGEKNINLTEAIGLRAPLSGGITAKSLSGNEEAAAKARRQESFQKFKEAHLTTSDSRFTKDLHKQLMERIKRFPEKDQKWLLQLREHIKRSFSQGQVLQREAFDMAPRPLAKLKDENFRPVIEEVQRQLYDTESAVGFKQWLADFAFEVYLDVYETRGLKFGNRQVSIRDNHANYPFSEGLHGIPAETIKLANIPHVTEADIIHVIDRRAHLYGFDEGLAKVPGVRLVNHAKYLATLDGFNLEDSTVLFVEYSKNNLLFQDTYFIGKPHGQYSHVFQWLYLAERMSQPEQNAFQANMIRPLMQVQPYFVNDYATGVRVTDFVGQRGPQNPDYINNLLQLIFPLD